MKELKFTPGPWEVSVGNKGSIFGDLNNAAHNGDNPYIGTVAGISVSEDIPECTANAKLIEAAPEMYAIIKELYDQAMRLGFNGSIVPSIKAVIEKIHAE